MSLPNFIHLRAHSDYAIVDGLLRIKPWIQHAKAHAVPALALTDFSNLFGLVKFYTAAINMGIKPIVGCDIVLRMQPGEESMPFTLLCQNQAGYRHLTSLISRAYREGQVLGVPIVDFSWLTVENCQALIALSGATTGWLGQQLLLEKPVVDVLEKLSDLFPQRFYLELQRLGKQDEALYIERVVKLAAQYNLPVVATNDVRFLTVDDFAAHEARVCIHEGDVLANPKRRQDYTREQYFKTEAQMCELFADIPEALANSVEIAKRCNLVLGLGDYYLPDFPVPSDVTVDQFLVSESERGLKQRLVKLFPDVSTRDIRGTTYQARLSDELDVIIKMGFPGYFLIVADFIRWAKENGVPVGPGRGSGAGSLVAYVLGITDLDPIALDLLFERFLNPERVSMPDFDIDFCMEGRDRVIQYVADKYGRENVSQIITYGTMAAKAVVRDVGRVLSQPYGFVDQIAKLIPFELGMTLKKALAQEPDLRNRYEREEEVQSLIDLALKLEGVTRNVGKHAGGVVIAPRPLTEFAPLYCEEDGSNLVTQFDKDDVEKIGLVKFDFLGLRTLTIIERALDYINQRNDRQQKSLDMSEIPLDDKATFALLKQCQTTAVFQLESRGMKDLIHRLEPDCFDEITALVALFRPGPLQSGMVDDFIDRKHGRAQVDYPHPDLAPILESTYGVILYQEQVMQIAQVLANYSLGSADILRRAMGKKKPEEMAKQRAIFMDGARKRDVDGGVAEHIFDLMEKFAGYGFNKSHSAAYALIAYQTAWLKAHYPAEFMAAVLSSDMDNTDKVVIFYQETNALGVTVRPPNINDSTWRFSVEKGEVLYGLGAIKGVGEGAIDQVVKARQQAGTFKSLFDFCERVDGKRVNRRVLEALIKAGAFDSLGVDRATLFASVDIALKAAERLRNNHAQGQSDLFGNLVDEPDLQLDYVEGMPWPALGKLSYEKDVLGHYVTGHPLDQYAHELSQVGQTVATLKAGMVGCVAGFVEQLRVVTTKRGDRMAIVQLRDKTGLLDVAIFSDLWHENRQIIQKDHLLVLVGEVSEDQFSGGLRLRAQQVMSMDAYREAHVKRCVISLQEVELDILPVTDCLRKYPGRAPLVFSLVASGGSAQWLASESWQVQPSEALLNQLAICFPGVEVRLQY